MSVRRISTALGEKIKELFPDGNADSRRFTIGIEDVMPNDLAKLFNDEMFSNLEISGSYCGVIIDFDSVPGASVTPAASLLNRLQRSFRMSCCPKFCITEISKTVPRRLPTV